MKKYWFYVTSTVFITLQNSALALEQISPELKNTLKNTSNEPSIFNIIFSLIVVIGLIYVTGIIYSKLNLVGAKTIKKQLKNTDFNRAIVVSTTQLGQNKNLHVIELNNKKYLIGATPNSINLIKDLSEAKPLQTEDIELPTSPSQDLQEQNNFEEEKTSDEIYKKYL